MVKTRWTDSGKVRIILTITGLLISGGFFTFGYKAAKSVYETNIVTVAMASPAVKQYVREIVREENEPLTRSINFLVALSYQHMSAPEIERAKGSSGMIVVYKNQLQPQAQP
jgi:hypothetical protein